MITGSMAGTKVVCWLAAGAMVAAGIAALVPAAAGAREWARTPQVTPSAAPTKTAIETVARMKKGTERFIVTDIRAVEPATRAATPLADKAFPAVAAKQATAPAPEVSRRILCLDGHVDSAATPAPTMPTTAAPTLRPSED